MQDLTSAVFQQLNQQPPAGGLGTGQFPEQEQLKCPRCDSTNTKFCYYNNYNLSQPRHFCKNCRRYWTKGGTLRNIPFGGGSRKNSSSSSSTGKRSSSSTSSNNISSSPSSFSKRGNPDLNSDTTRSTRRHVPDPSITIASTSGAATVGAAQKVLGIGSSGSAEGVTPVFGLESAVGGGGSSFSSLLRSSGQLVSVFQGLGPNGPGHLGVKMGQSGDSGGGGLVDDLNSDSVSRLGSDPNWRVEDGRGNGNNGSGGGEEGYLESGEWGNSNGWPDLAIYTPGSGFY